MALHMTDDPQDQQDYNENSNTGGGHSRGGGGGGGLLNFLPLLLMLFKGGGKGGILILLLVAGGYFLMRQGSCGGISQAAEQYSKGGMLDPNEFSKASVYEGLADDNVKNPLPEAVSLRRFAPDRQNQGKQGSCVAWSCAFAARTILESTSTNTNPNSTAFSPAFMYNQIGLDGCQGSYLIRAMEFLTRKGAVPYNDFLYDENDCSRGASASLEQKAQQYKMHGFNRLTEDDGVSKLSFRAIKEHLAKDAPVVIGMMVGGSFMEGMMGQKVWHPSREDYSQMGFGGHAMCVIGYDDRIEGGAFEIMNSWGPDWGQNGIGYVRYGDFNTFVREAYGLDPMPKKGAALNKAFACAIGLVDNQSKSYIPLKAAGGNLFKTTAAITKGSRFKIEIKNEVECYIYLFTPDVAGKSFVLFPYKPVHSPYCGITGTRLFPRKESIQADDNGNKEVMGVIVSKQALDYNKLNAAINANTQVSFAAKFNAVTNSDALKDVQYNNTGTGSIYFNASTGNESKIVTCVVEIDKR
jgi:C1A family cysteine protease